MIPKWALSGLAAATIIIGSLFSSTRLILETYDVPEDEQYGKAKSPILEAGFDQAHDALVILPPWSLRPLKDLADFNPISGDQIWRRPLLNYRSTFALVEPDADKWLRAMQKNFGGGEVIWDDGPLSLWKFKTGNTEESFSFSEQISKAKIQIQGAKLAGKSIECTYKETSGHRCDGRPKWQRVRKEWLLVSENGDQALWAHPPNPKESLSILFSDVSLGNVIVIRSGHTRDASRKAKAPVNFRIKVNGQEIFKRKIPPRFDFDIDILDLGTFANTTGTVEFLISTSNNKKNHFAFDAYTGQHNQRQSAFLTDSTSMLAME